MEGNWTLSNRVINDGVFTVDGCSIEEGIGRYTSPMSLVQDYSDADGTSVCVKKRRALLVDWLGWIAALLNLDDTKD